MKLRVAIKIYLKQKQPDILWIHKKFLYNKALSRINKCKNKKLITKKQLNREYRSIMRNKNLGEFTKKFIKARYKKYNF